MKDEFTACIREIITLNHCIYHHWLETSITLNKKGLHGYYQRRCTLEWVKSKRLLLGSSSTLNKNYFNSWIKVFRLWFPIDVHDLYYCSILQLCLWVVLRWLNRSVLLDLSYDNAKLFYCFTARIRSILRWFIWLIHDYFIDFGTLNKLKSNPWCYKICTLCYLHLDTTNVRDLLPWIRYCFTPDLRKQHYTVSFNFSPLIFIAFEHSIVFISTTEVSYLMYPK